jgi:hypothetical protein
MATYTPSGGSTLNFHLLVDPPERETREAMAERTIRGATNSVVSFIGKPVTKIRGQARFDSYGGLTTFEGVVGTQGSLVYSEEPSGIPVAFVALQRMRVTPHDIHVASVEFWLLPSSTVIQSVAISASIGGTAVSNVISARISYDFNGRTAECRLVTPIKPSGTYDNAVSVAISASGSSPVTRFTGLVRDYQYSNTPPQVTTIARGNLTRAVEYENGEVTVKSPWDHVAGLLIPDLVGTLTATAAAIVEAALTKAGVSYTSTNIHGSTVDYGGGISPLPFLWRYGGPGVNDMPIAEQAGETAMAYIERYDNIDAEITGDNSGGRYRTFEQVGGAVFRLRVGGRPQGTPDHTLTGGVDILAGEFQRSISQTRNYFVVMGQDRGQGFANLNFALASSNPFQPSGTKHTYSLSSDMIERDLDSDSAHTGMSCETVANALELEYNREIVTGWLETWRDDLFGLAQTHLVQGAAGGLVGDLGVAENLWVQSVDITVDERGFTQRMSYLGGGLSSEVEDIGVLRAYEASLVAAAV